MLTALGAPLPAAAEQGEYGPVALRGKEPHDLIETASQYHGQFERRALLHNEPSALALVRQVGSALAPEPTDPYFAYEFFVVRDPSPNAFAMPNGRIYVHTGMLARLEDSSQLAALLGHEITHVAGHHGIVQYRIKAGQVVDMIFTGGVVSLFTQLKFSRDLEQEADDRAPALMLDAGYDPHAVPELMALLAEDFEGLRPRIGTIWTTHPDPEDRHRRSLAAVEALPPAPRDRADFDATMRPLRAMTVRDYIRDDYPYTAIAVTLTFMERYPLDLEYRVLLGDAIKALGARHEFAPEDFTDKDRRRNLRQRYTRTRAERVDLALETEAGRLAYAENMARAEAVYRDVLERDPAWAAAHRGLGEVYEALDRPRDAARSYIEYVRSVPDAADRPIIMSRLTAIRDGLAAEESSYENQP
jgi:predicted Zn-dependent protease